MPFSYRFLLLSLWLSTAILTTACKDDDPAPQTQTGALAGQVTPATAIAVVTATSAGGQKYTATPNATGAFAFVTLTTGTYTVSYTPAAGYRAPTDQPTTVTVNTTTTLPAVTVLPDYSLTGQVRPAGAVTLVTATAANGQTYTIVPDADGGYAFVALPPGTYTIGYTVASGYLPTGTQTGTVSANVTTPLPAIGVQLSKPAMLTASRWRIMGMQMTDNATGTVTDIFSSYPNCSRDDFYTFNPSGTVIFDTGTAKCTFNDPQTTTGSWELLNNYTQLRMTFGSNPPETQEVVELTESLLHVRDSVSGSTFDTYFTTL